MSRQLPLILCLLFILWLFARDQKYRSITSSPVWIAFLWIVINGTRPLSLWLGAGIQVESLDDYLDGSPLDRNALLIIIIAGMIILFKRRAELTNIIAKNKWVFVFFIYCGMSVIWSDYPFTSLKRWIKDVGNLVMVLLILTDRSPFETLRAVLSRFTYIAIPLSFVFIKYLPEFGRYYNRWTYEQDYCGISTEKNSLGQILFICGIFLIWDLLEMKNAGEMRKNTLALISRIILVLMMIWLLRMAHSSTATVCYILGTGILLFLRTNVGKRQVRYLGTYCFAIGLLICLLYTIPGILEAVVGILGRDISLTGRTDLWADLLKAPINPLIGEGFQSFWQTPIAARIGEKFYFIPNQAHNGYLEVYLQTGLIGLFLLIAVIISTGSKFKKKLLLGDSYAVLCFSLFIVCLVNNWTEATFNKLSLVWIILIMTALNYRHPTVISTNKDECRDGISGGHSSLI